MPTYSLRGTVARMPVLLCLSRTVTLTGKRLPGTSDCLSLVSPAPQTQFICLHNAIIGVSAASPGMLRTGPPLSYSRYLGPVVVTGPLSSKVHVLSSEILSFPGPGTNPSLGLVVDPDLPVSPDSTPLPFNPCTAFFLDL